MMCIIMGLRWNKVILLCIVIKYYLKFLNLLCFMFVLNKSIILNLELIVRVVGFDYINGVLVCFLFFE